LADIAEAELFGEEVEQEDVWRKEVGQVDAWRKSNELNLPPKMEATFSALFTEAEVGMIVGLLKSRDEAIRKLVSPSSHGVPEFANKLTDVDNTCSF
jgi:hypothetical protein